MSYYIAPHSDKPIGTGTIIYRVVERLSDYKPEEGQKYRVFKSRKAMKTSHFIDLYIGKNGKLKKLKDEALLRFI